MYQCFHLPFKGSLTESGGAFGDDSSLLLQLLVDDESENEELLRYMLIVVKNALTTESEIQVVLPYQCDSYLALVLYVKCHRNQPHHKNFMRDLNDKRALCRTIEAHYVTLLECTIKFHPCLRPGKNILAQVCGQQTITK